MLIGVAASAYPGCDSTFEEAEAMSISIQNHVAGQRTPQVLNGQSELRGEVELFLIDRAARNLAKGSLDFYKQKLGHFCEYAEEVGVGKVEDLTPKLLRQWVVKEAEHRTPGGVHALFRSTRAFVRWWEIEFEPEGWRNPFRKVPAPRVPEELLPPVPDKDFVEMVGTCKGRNFLDHRDRAFLIALVDTGCRAGEFRALNLNDIDRGTGAVLVRQGKSRKPRHTFLSRRALSALARYLHYRRDAEESAPLWVSRNRVNPLKYAGIRSIVRRRAQKAGVPEPNLHSFRRACAITLHRDGADVISIQRLLGHKDLNTTRLYLALSSEDLGRVHSQHAPGDRLLG